MGPSRAWIHAVVGPNNAVHSLKNRSKHPTGSLAVSILGRQKLTCTALFGAGSFSFDLLPRGMGLRRVVKGKKQSNHVKKAGKEDGCG